MLVRPNLCQARLTLDRGYVLGSGEALWVGGDRLLKPHGCYDDERWDCSGQWSVVSGQWLETSAALAGGVLEGGVAGGVPPHKGGP